MSDAFEVRQAVWVHVDKPRHGFIFAIEPDHADGPRIWVAYTTSTKRTTDTSRRWFVLACPCKARLFNALRLKNDSYIYVNDQCRAFDPAVVEQMHKPPRKVPIEIVLQLREVLEDALEAGMRVAEPLQALASSL